MGIGAQRRRAWLCVVVVACLTALACLIAPGAQAATDPAALVWSPPQVLDPSLHARQPRVQLTESGEAIVAWTNQGRVLTARIEPSGQVLRQTLWRGSPAAQAQVLLSATPDGHALVGWVAGGRMRVAYRRPGHAFAQVAVPGGARARNPAAAIDDRGDAALVWQTRQGRQALTPVLLTRCGARHCSAPRTIARRGFQPHVGVDGGGTATVEWTGGAKEREVLTLDVSQHGPGRHAHTFRLGGNVSGVHLQEAPSGAAVVSWGSRTPIESARPLTGRPAGLSPRRSG